MITSKENVKIFAIDGIGFIIGEVILKDDASFSGVTIRHPFKLIPGQDGQLSVAPVFIKEEYATFNIAKIICELSVEENILNVFEKYSQKVHSSIILPDNHTGLGLIK